MLKPFSSTNSLSACHEVAIRDGACSYLLSFQLGHHGNVNSLGNQRVDALVLPETGYSSHTGQYDLRFVNALTVGTKTSHPFMSSDCR